MYRRTSEFVAAKHSSGPSPDFRLTRSVARPGSAKGLIPKCAFIYLGLSAIYAGIKYSTDDRYRSTVYRRDIGGWISVRFPIQKSDVFAHYWLSAARKKSEDWL